MDIKEALTFDGLKYFYTKYIKPLKTGAFSTVVNNATTTVANTVLDGRMGKTLADKDANLQSQIDALNSSLVDVKIKWEYVTDNFMKRIRPYCTSRQTYVIFFQLTGTATEVGKMPLFSLGFLMTNGSDRHSITVNAGFVTDHIQGFNNNDTYDESTWNWYRYNTPEVS